MSGSNFDSGIGRVGPFLLCIGLSWPNVAFAQRVLSPSPDQSLSASRYVVLEYTPAEAGFNSSAALSPIETVVGIYTLYDQNQRSSADGGPVPYWIMRKASGVGDKVQEVQWADSRNCPQMISVLNRMAALVPSRIEVRGMRRFEPPRALPALDGVTYTIWSEAGQQPSEHFGGVQIWGNSGPIAEFGRYATTALQTCWRDQQPKLSVPRAEKP